MSAGKRSLTLKGNPLPAKTPADKRAALELQKLELEVAELRIEIADRERLSRQAAVSSHAARVYPFVGEVTSSSAKYAIERITEWYRDDPEAPIEIVFNSPGGSVFAGLALYDYLRMISDAGTPVTTMSVGWAASMAGVLLQAGSTRLMSKNAWLMVHEASTATWGKASELRDEVELMDKLESQILDILAERSTLSAKQIKNRSARRDWWLSASDALKFGFIDGVVG
jgi:ATP-dependent Clp protease, protease subunit